MVTSAVLPIAARAWRVSLDTVIEPPPPGSGRDGESAVMQAVADAWTLLLRRHPTHWAAVDPLPWLDVGTGVTGRP